MTNADLNALALEAKKGAEYFSSQCKCPPASSQICVYCQYGGVFKRLVNALTTAATPPSVPTLIIIGDKAVSRKLLIERLTDAANDPMWADHAEVPKMLLQFAVKALTTPPSATPSAGGDCPQCHDAGKVTAAISGETYGPSIDSARRRHARDNPVTCPSCKGTGKQSFDPATIGITLAADDHTFAEVARIDAKAVCAEQKLNSGARALPPITDEVRTALKKAEVALSLVICPSDEDTHTSDLYACELALTAVQKSIAVLEGKRQ